MKLQELLSEIKTLSLPDLIDLYLEARKGSYTTAIDLLPFEALERITELEDFINNAISEG
jgi:hypothetical protein